MIQEETHDTRRTKTRIERMDILKKITKLQLKEPVEIDDNKKRKSVKMVQT